MNKAEQRGKGGEQIDLTGNTFAAISRVFQEVAQQVAEIAKAAEDVGAGSEEIAAPPRNSPRWPTPLLKSQRSLLTWQGAPKADF